MRFLSRGCVVAAALGVCTISCSGRRGHPVAASPARTEGVPLCPDGHDVLFSHNGVVRGASAADRAELKAIFAKRDDNGCLTIRDRSPQWEGNVLKLGYWQIDASRRRQSFAPFITDRQLPEGRPIRVVPEFRGLPCFATVSPTGEFVAWPDGGGCEPDAICVARVGAAQGSCHQKPGDHRPILRAQIEDLLAKQGEYFWLVRDETGLQCQRWAVTSRSTAPPMQSGAAQVYVSISTIHRVGSREERLTSTLYLDQDLPGVYLTGPSYSLYENGAFVNGGIPLCEAAIGVDRIDDGAIWTSKGPWYLSARACDVALASIERSFSRETVAATQRVECKR
jgi:hypothetical protein